MKILPRFFILLFCCFIALCIFFLEYQESPYVSSVAYLYLVPVSCAAYFYGMRTAIFVALLCCVFYAPFVAHEFSVSPAEGIEEFLDFFLFVITGIAAGYLSDRLRIEKKHAYFHSRLEEIASSSLFDAEKLSSSFRDIFFEAGGSRRKPASPITENLLRSLQEAHDVHLKRAALMNDIFLTNALLESILSRVPFGAARFCEDNTIRFQNAFFDNNPELLQKAVDAATASREQSEISLLHEGHEFLARNISLTAMKDERLLLVQDMEDKRNYERARENYRIKSAFLSHVSEAFIEKVSGFERAFQCVETEVLPKGKGDVLASSEDACRALLTYVDELLTQAKQDAKDK